MSRKEAPRAGLIKAALAGQITNAQGAQALRISVRQFRRLKARYRQHGVRGLLHGLRGRASPRALDAAVRARVVEPVETTYRDFNDCHCNEKLREVERLPVSRSTVRRLRRARGMGYGTAAYLTAIGDTVHVASRLEQLTKEYGTMLVISEPVAARAGLDVSAFPRHDQTVRNRREPLPIRVIHDPHVLRERLEGVRGP